MITVSKLFWRRLASDWKYQYEAWKTAVDWVVALYIVIPFLGIFIYQYLSWCREVPGWLSYVPMNALLGLIFLFTWSGTTRIFLEEADQLFLWQKKAWITRFIKLCLGYNFAYNLIASTLLFLILAPFLVLHYGLYPLKIVWFAVFTSGFKTSMGLIKQLAALRFKGWIYNLVRTVLFLITGVYWRQSFYYLSSFSSLFYLSLILLYGALFWLMFKRLTVQGAFFQDVSREKNARFRLAKLLLMNMGTYEKKPKITRKRPLLFRNSKLLFKKRNPVNGLVEMFLKSELRNEEDVSFYLKRLGISILAILAFPPSYGWLLWLVFSLMITSFVGVYWREAISNPFICLFPWLSETKVTAAKKSIFFMALPGQFMLGLVVVLKAHAWLEVPVIIPIVLLIGYFSANLVSLKS